MRTKRTYKAIDVERLAAAEAAAAFSGSRCIVGIDVAKKDMFASLSNDAGESKRIVRFEHPARTQSFVNLCVRIGSESIVEVAMESTGTYGDALRGQLTAAGFRVFQVNAKRCHDAATVLDGVPSSHDRKSAVLIGWLHARGISREWRAPTDGERAARASLARRELYADPLARNRGRLEALVARHWPELSTHLDLDSTSLLTLLSTYRSPRNTHAHHDVAVEVLRKAARGALTEEKILAVLTSAPATLGVPMTPDEETLVHELAEQSLALRNNVRRIDEEIAALARCDVAMGRLAAALGATSAAAIVAHLGDPAGYESTAALVKAAGLNLRERSSGKHVGQLKLTKRGPARVRFYLYFAALRLVRSDPAVRAWYKRRRGHTIENRMSAVVAVMRKLASALPHVARGAAFDSAKLFDTRRLDLVEVAAPKRASPVELEVTL